MKTEQNDTKSGSGAILVYDNSLSKGFSSDFYIFLKSEGFEYRSHHGFYESCPWVYVNLNSKTYAPGMPGVRLAQELGNHAITIEEFMTIYSIYKKYDGKSPLEF